MFVSGGISVVKNNHDKLVLSSGCGRFTYELSLYIYNDIKWILSNIDYEKTSLIVLKE